MGLNEALTRLAFAPEKPVIYLFQEAALPDAYHPLATGGADFFTLCVTLSARPTTDHDNGYSVSHGETEMSARLTNGLENARSFAHLLNGHSHEIRVLGTRSDILVKREDA